MKAQAAVNEAPATRLKNMKSWPLASFISFIPGASLWTSAIGGHDLSRILQVCLMTACAIMLVGSRKPAADTTSLPMKWAIAALCAMAWVSVLRASVPLMAARELAVFAGMVGIAALVVESDGAYARPYGWATVVTLSATCYSGQILIAALIRLLNSDVVDPSDLFVGYDNYRLFNHVQTVMLPLLAIAAGLGHTQRLVARLAWSCLALGVSLIAFTSARGTAAGLLVACVLALFLFKRQSFPFLWRAATASAAGIAAFIVSHTLVQQVTTGSAAAPMATRFAGWESDHSRFYLWSIAWRDIADSPFFGIGPMQFAHHVNAKGAHPHNVYLQVAAEWGLPILLLLVLMSALFLARLAKAIAACDVAQEKCVGMGLFIALVAVAVDGLFSGNFVMPVSQVWIALAAGLAFAWLKRQPAPRSNADGRPNRVWAGALKLGIAALAAGQFFLLATAMPEALNLENYLAGVSSRYSHGGKPAPRFWSNGWF